MVAAGALVLTSCGGASVSKETADVITMKSDLNSSYESFYADQLDAYKSFYETEKEILKEYGGEEKNLRDKVKAKDEKAIDAWIELETARYEMEKDLDETARSTFGDDIWAVRTSERLIRMMMDPEKDKDAIKKFRDDMKIQDDKKAEIEDKFHQDFAKWHDNEFCKKDCDKGHYNPFREKSSGGGDMDME